MKFKDLFSITRNKKNKQYIFSLRIKKLRKMGMTPEQLREMTMPKPKVSLLGDFKK